MRKFVWFCLVVLLGGCATKVVRIHGPANMQAYEERHGKVAEIPSFELRGRVGIRTVDKGWSGGLVWSQQGEQLDIRFRGPLGTGGIQVTGDAENLRVQTSRGDDFMTSEAELDFTEEFGGSLPVRALRYWMLGIPYPGDSFEQLEVGQDGLLWSMSQNGWQVEFANYAYVVGESEDGQILRLPDRLRISHGNFMIKLVIKDWALPDSCD
ncbi:MAG: lipoprotein insertase outer membrane protein LolB [Gammaproteobacteria bacterium]